MGVGEDVTGMRERGGMEVGEVAKGSRKMGKEEEKWGWEGNMLILLLVGP